MAGPSAAADDGPVVAALVLDALGAGGAAEPGVAVSVCRTGQAGQTHCVGLANLPHGVPITSDTRFRIASISKQMVAALVLLMADDGRLALDDPLHGHLPEMPAFEPPVTLRHLLTMTSGLHEVTHLAWLATGDLTCAGIADAEWRRLMTLQTAPGFAAGSRYLYNNANYLLLQWVVERITGQPLAASLRERLFEPLGMADTMLPGTPTQPLDRLAGGYRKAADGRFDEPAGWRNAGAAGGIVSTLRDLTRWGRALLDNGLPGRDLARRLAEPFVHPAGARSHYGLGLGTGVFAGRRWLGHAGGLAGFSTDQIVLPDHGLVVTVLANRDDLKAMRLSRRIADHLVDGRSVLDGVCSRPPPPPAADTLPWIGVYASADAARVVEIAAGPGLPTANGMLLDRDGPEGWAVLIGDEPLCYRRQDDGGLLESHPSGVRSRLHRTALVPPTGLVADGLIGGYRAAGTGTAWCVARHGDRLQLGLDSPWRVADRFDLLQAAPDLLVMAPHGGAVQCNSVLRVERDATGRVRALVGHFDRSRGLRLERHEPSAVPAAAMADHAADADAGADAVAGADAGARTAIASTAANGLAS